MDEFCQKWKIQDSNSFLFKAQQNLICAAEARKKSLFDIEANRIYYALHQLACELVRLGCMNNAPKGSRATSDRPYKLAHGSYHSAIRKAIAIDNIDFVFSEWSEFRNMADYDHEQICTRMQWQKTITKKRKKAQEAAQAIYEKLQDQYK